MIRSQSLVDYERFCTAKVVIFIDNGNPDQTYQLLTAHGEAIERLCGLFSARVLMGDRKRLKADFIIENEIADAWILLVPAGRNRGLATGRDPQRINVDAKSDWEAYAFRELNRQIRETAQIIEEVTAPYRRYTRPENPAPPLSAPLGSS
jgi:hypothetical protein